MQIHRQVQLAKTKLNFSENSLPNVRCSRFEQWVDLKKIDSISLIFVSAFMGNPASMYGHALLRLNYLEDYKGRNLLAPTFSYGASVDPEDSSISYLFKGLSGGYQGKYAVFRKIYHSDGVPYSGRPCHYCDKQILQRQKIPR